MFLTVNHQYIQIKLTIKSFTFESAKPNFVAFYMNVLLGTASMYIF